MTTTNGLLYLIDMETRERLEIQFVPLEVSINRTVQMDGVQIVGRNTPRYEQTGGEKTVALKLDFHASEESKQDALDKARWIESRTYNDGYRAPASRLQLVFGDLFSTKDVWVIKSCPYVVSQFDKTKGFLPSQVMMDLVLGLSTKTNLRRRDVY